MNVVDKEKYDDWKNKNSDPYGSYIFRYAERWADMMEIYLEDKEVKVKDIAKKTSHDADTEGITGFMYGMAVSVLARCWAHGEELRKWHNGEYEHDGDGVVNPAILTVSQSVK